MKKVKIVIIIAIVLIVLGFTFSIIDYNRIKKCEKPLFVVKISSDKDPTNYIGLGYRFERWTGISDKADLCTDYKQKFGFWVYTWDIKK